MYHNTINNAKNQQQTEVTTTVAHNIIKQNKSQNNKLNKHQTRKQLNNQAIMHTYSIQINQRNKP